MYKAVIENLCGRLNASQPVPALDLSTQTVTLARDSVSQTASLARDCAAQTPSLPTSSQHTQTEGLISTLLASFATASKDRPEAKADVAATPMETEGPKSPIKTEAPASQVETEPPAKFKSSFSDLVIRKRSGATVPAPAPIHVPVSGSRSINTSSSLPTSISTLNTPLRERTLSADNQPPRISDIPLPDMIPVGDQPESGVAAGLVKSTLQMMRSSISRNMNLSSTENSPSRSISRNMNVDQSPSTDLRQSLEQFKSLDQLLRE